MPLDTGSVASLCPVSIVTTVNQDYRLYPEAPSAIFWSRVKSESNLICLITSENILIKKKRHTKHIFATYPALRQNLVFVSTILFNLALSNQHFWQMTQFSAKSLPLKLSKLVSLQSAIKVNSRNLTVNTLFVQCSFKIDMHQNMLISLFRTI